MQPPPPAVSMPVRAGHAPVTTSNHAGVQSVPAVPESSRVDCAIACGHASKADRGQRLADGPPRALRWPDGCRGAVAVVAMDLPLRRGGRPGGNPWPVLSEIETLSSGDYRATIATNSDGPALQCRTIGVKSDAQRRHAVRHGFQPPKVAALRSLRTRHAPRPRAVTAANLRDSIRRGTASPCRRPPHRESVADCVRCSWFGCLKTLRKTPKPARARLAERDAGWPSSRTSLRPSRSFSR